MELILGTAQLARPYGVLDGRTSKRSLVDAAKLLHFSEALGFEALDTAPVYGEAEMVIGRSGVGLPVHTKLVPNVSPEHSVEASLKRLGRRFLDVVYLHQPLELATGQQNLLADLSSLKGDCVGAVGVSIYEEREFELALSNPLIDVIQVPYNLFDQRFGPRRISEAISHGKLVFARSIFLQGILLVRNGPLPDAVSPLQPGIERLRDFSESQSLSLLKLAMAFAQANSGLAGLVVGASNHTDLEEISAAAFSNAPVGLLEELGRMDWPRWPATDPRRWG